MYKVTIAFLAAVLLAVGLTACKPAGTNETTTTVSSSTTSSGSDGTTGAVS